MRLDIQQLLDNSKPNSTVQLPSGEYEGPFNIWKPLIITGNSTTLWGKKGPVLVVESSGVTIKNARIEITEFNDNPDDFLCLVSKAKDTKYEKVEIIGNVKGINGEENSWDIPKIIPLGDFPSENKTSFIIEVEVPVDVTIKSTIKDVSIIPNRLNPGRSKVTISVEKLKDGTFVYGEILFESVFIRRSYINGSARSGLAGFKDGRIIYQPKNSISTINREYENHVSEANIIAPMISDSTAAVLKKGQRLSIKGILDNEIQITLSYDKLMQHMEIDPYIFMLDKNRKAKGDENLVFFGNKSSKCGGIRILDDGDVKSAAIDLNKIPEDIQVISVSYSIYGDNPSNNFSKVINPTIRILSEGKEKLRYSPKDLLIETTITFIEFYRYKNEWKINTVGAGYREGLKRLCESFGFTVV